MIWVGINTLINAETGKGYAQLTMGRQWIRTSITM